MKLVIKISIKVKNYFIQLSMKEVKIYSVMVQLKNFSIMMLKEDNKNKNKIYILLFQ